MEEERAKRETNKEIKEGERKTDQDREQQESI